MLLEKPCVFVVGNTYQIIAMVKSESIMWIRVGNNNYYDDSNGILNSGKNIHKVTVPMKELDKAGKYVICERDIIERKPYFPELKKTVESEFAFKAVKKKVIRAYHIADAHNLENEPIKAAKGFGSIDFLILNGDIPNHSGDIKNFRSIYKISGEITGGSIPVVFARGNHDLRGKFAEDFADYTPTQNGNSYYTFRLGSIWGVILDCGEDKCDEYEDYNGTICCHSFRERQIEFLNDIIKNNADEYNAKGVKTKLVISHVPFTIKKKYPFDIEQEIYQKWTNIINKKIKPDLMICGHKHRVFVVKKGDENDDLGCDCPVLIASDINMENNYFAGAGIIFRGGNSFSAEMTDTDGKKEKIQF